MVISLASASAFSVISSKVRRRISARWGGGDRVERVLHGPVGHLGHRVLGGRVDDRQRAAASPAGPLPADQQVRGYFDPDQLGPVAHHSSYLVAPGGFGGVVPPGANRDLRTVS